MGRPEVPMTLRSSSNTVTELPMLVCAVQVPISMVMLWSRMSSRLVCIPSAWVGGGRGQGLGEETQVGDRGNDRGPGGAQIPATRNRVQQPCGQATAGHTWNCCRDGRL